MCAHKYPGPHELGQNQLTDPRVDRAVVYLIVGLPGAGKTTHAKELETSEAALRLTPDEWQISLFGDQNPPDKRDLVEGKLVQLGMRAAQLGINVVFDFGFLGKTNGQRCVGSLALSVRVAKSSTCRLITRSNAGVSPIGSQPRPIRRST
jgi:AAA domain